MPVPSGSRADVFADRVARFRRKSSSSQRSYSSPAQQKVIKSPQTGGASPQFTPVGAPAVPAPVGAPPSAPSSTPARSGVPDGSWSDVEIEAYYGAPAGSAAQARAQGWGGSSTSPQPSFGPMSAEGYPTYAGLGGAVNSLPQLAGNPGPGSAQQPGWDAQLKAGTASLPTGVAYGPQTGVQYSGEHLQPGQLSGPSLPGYSIGSAPSNDRTKPFDPVAEQKFWADEHQKNLEVQRLNATPNASWSDQDIEAFYGAPPGSAALARAQGWRG